MYASNIEDEDLYDDDERTPRGSDDEGVERYITPPPEVNTVLREPSPTTFFPSEELELVTSDAKIPLLPRFPSDIKNKDLLDRLTHFAFETIEALKNLRPPDHPSKITIRAICSRLRAFSSRHLSVFYNESNEAPQEEYEEVCGDLFNLSILARSAKRDGVSKACQVEGFCKVALTLLPATAKPSLEDDELDGIMSRLLWAAYHNSQSRSGWVGVTDDLREMSRVEEMDLERGREFRNRMVAECEDFKSETEGEKALDLPAKDLYTLCRFFANKSDGAPQAILSTEIHGAVTSAARVWARSDGWIDKGEPQ